MHEERTCTKAPVFGSRRAARRAARSRVGKVAYKCKRGDHYHIGSRYRRRGRHAG